MGSFVYENIFLVISGQPLNQSNLYHKSNQIGARTIWNRRSKVNSDYFSLLIYLYLIQGDHLQLFQTEWMFWIWEISENVKDVFLLRRRTPLAVFFVNFSYEVLKLLYFYQLGILVLDFSFLVHNYKYDWLNRRYKRVQNQYSNLTSKAQTKNCKNYSNNLKTSSLRKFIKSELFSSPATSSPPKCRIC